METNGPTDDSTDTQTQPEKPVQDGEYPPELPLGDAEVQIDVDEQTYQRVHEEYCRSVEHGYTDTFPTFVFNHCLTDCYVTVDGEPVDPDAEE